MKLDSRTNHGCFRSRDVVFWGQIAIRQTLPFISFGHQRIFYNKKNKEFIPVAFKTFLSLLKDCYLSSVGKSVQFILEGIIAK